VAHAPGAIATAMPAWVGTIDRDGQPVGVVVGRAIRVARRLASNCKRIAPHWIR
jgi:hypothetical protein